MTRKWTSNWQLVFSWSSTISEERMTSREGTFRVTYLANMVPNKESLSPKGLTNRRSGPIYFESKLLRAECVTLDSNEKKCV